VLGLPLGKVTNLQEGARAMWARIRKENYYGSFYQSAMNKLFRYIDSRLEKWARRKYKTLWRNKRRSEQWLSRLKNETPHMFAHWHVVGNGVG
jgi:RNA-directed DNA polymerase